MSDTIDDDRLADAFEQLRTQLGPHIVAPGTGEVRRTVGRRRTVRLVASTVLAIAVLGIAGVLAVTTRGGNHAEPASTPTEPAAPVLAESELDQLAVQALAQLGYQPNTSRPGTVFGALSASQGAFSYQLGTTEQPFPAGQYHVAAACAGQGTVVIRLSVPGVDDVTVAAHCGAEPGANGFFLPRPDVIDLQVFADEKATGHAGFAVVFSKVAPTASR